MVTTDISQLTADCSSWRQHMRNYRDELNQLKDQLRQIAPTITHKDLLKDVEHFENQFHIQLINIHDLKHAIKVHDFKASVEKASIHERDIVAVEHEKLSEQYSYLKKMLQELKEGFKQFVNKLP